MITPEVEARVFWLCGGRCARCKVVLSPRQGLAISFHVDHIVPRSQGGSDRLSNLQPLCRTCNLRKGASYADYRPRTKPTYDELYAMLLPVNCAAVRDEITKRARENPEQRMMFLRLRRDLYRAAGMVA